MITHLVKHLAKRGVRCVVVAVLAIACVVSVVRVASAQQAQQIQQAQTYQPIRLVFQSAKQYAHPHKDVSLRCVFSHSASGRSIAIEGFWNGNQGTASEYQIRFAPPLAGDWTWRTTCSDTANATLHSSSGTIRAQAYSGANSLYAKGFQRVSPDGQYLVYANGEPFFYLADTAWEMMWNSTLDEARALVSDRKRKGFTAIQFVMMSHIFFTPDGITNQSGQKFVLKEDFSMLNPRYFDYIDSVVSMMNDSGIVAVICPQWAAGLTDINRMSWSPKNPISNENVKLIGRYAASRYAGSHVFWIVGGDAPYDTPARKQFWGEFGTLLHQTCGRQHLALSHCAGFTSSFDWFRAADEWLDFHTYAPGHLQNNRLVWQVPEQAKSVRPTKPLLNIETLYEDIVPGFWRANPDKSVRATAYDMRWQSYHSVLTGAKVGIAYGVNAVWQWHTFLRPITWLDPRFFVDSALKLPGAAQMGIFRRVMERYKWHELQPRSDVIATPFTNKALVSAAQSTTALVSYISAGVEYVTLNTGELGSRQRYRWINPITGDSTALQPVAQPLALRSPDTKQDWIIAVTKDTALSSSGHSQPATTGAGVATVKLFPNPSSTALTIEFADTKPRTIRLQVFALTGEHVISVTEPQPTANFQVRLNTMAFAVGMHFYTLWVDGTAHRGQFSVVR